jgi:hypothetical protein
MAQEVNSDTVVAVASNYYSDLPVHKRLLMGKNYRTTWGTPVRFPVFHLSGSQFKVEELGGSKQTYSLYLRDSTGHSWVLRSVDKDVSKAYPGMLQWTPVVPFKQDLISANYPYAALVVADIMKSAHIPAPEPVYYYVADDDALGEYRNLFSNTICMLEKKDPTLDGTEAIDMDSLLKVLKADSSARIVQKQLLKVRILDMLIGDPDRHAGQFRWGSVDSAGVKYYYPIPRDRDFAFFSSGGLLPFMLQILVGRPQVHYTGSSKNLKKLNHKCLEFDKDFLAGFSEADWEQTAQVVLNEMSDEVIDQAVMKLPPEIHQIDGQTIASKLKARRKGFVENVVDYYRFLFKERP